jgi:hypothetical protein
MLLIYFYCLQPAPLRRGGEDQQEVPGGARARGLHISRLAWRPPQVSFSLGFHIPRLARQTPQVSFSLGLHIPRLAWRSPQVSLLTVLVYLVCGSPGPMKGLSGERPLQSWPPYSPTGLAATSGQFQSFPLSVFRIRRIHMFLGFPDPLVTSTVRIWILPFYHKSVEQTEVMIAN